jgi:serine phosphatase RsbU (regulator of sigma subunit)
MLGMSKTDDPAPEDGTVFMTQKSLAAFKAAAEPSAHFLLLHEENEPPRRIRLADLPMTVGRTEPAGLVLAGSTVSRRHCRFDLEGDRLRLADLGSTNGTFVDGQRITAEVVLEDGARIAIGAHLLTYERRSQRAAEEALAQDRDLQQAVDYVMSILPPPIEAGPVRTDWFYLPCSRLGGDAFGYQALDERHFSIFVIDVAGHGTGAALHSVTVANVLRQRMLPGVDFRDPAQVMGSLNQMFQMEQHNWLFFTIWYGVYDVVERTLTFCSAGHHPAALVLPGGQRTEAGVRNPAIGVKPAHMFQADRMSIPSGSTLYVFSDGVFEIVDVDGRQWEMEDFLHLLPERSGPGEARRLYDAVRRTARPGPLDDDFSVMLASFV